MSKSSHQTVTIFADFVSIGTESSEGIVPGQKTFTRAAKADVKQFLTSKPSSTSTNPTLMIPSAKEDDYSMVFVVKYPPALAYRNCPTSSGARSATTVMDLFSSVHVAESGCAFATPAAATWAVWTPTRQWKRMTSFFTAPSVAKSSKRNGRYSWSPESSSFTDR